jgi:hypothetical protein
MMLFAAATMNFFLVRSRVWETVALLLVTFTLFRPGFWMDQFYPRFDDVEPARLLTLARELGPDERLAFTVEGEDLDGEPFTKVVTLRLDPGATPEERLTRSGVTLLRAGDSFQVGSVRLRSPAAKAGLQTGQRVISVKVPADRPSEYLFYIPAFALLGIVVAVQLARRRGAAQPATA